jgi:hypothetical protein
MPCFVGFNPKQHKIHDDNLKAAAGHAKNAASASKAMHADFRKIQVYAESVTEAAMKGELPGGASADDLCVHETLSKFSEYATAILKAGPQQLSKAELKKHHKNLAAIIPMLKKNAKRAEEISTHLMGIHRSFSKITSLYS